MVPNIITAGKNTVGIRMPNHPVTLSLLKQLNFPLAAPSASYIAVPAAMKISVPKANPGLYLPMALAVTFPINITVGMPIYFLIIESTF